MQQPPPSEQTYKDEYKMMMKRFIFFIAALALSVSVSAQTSDYLRKYNMLLSRVGPSGVGMETLIDSWAKAEPDNADVLQARFYFYVSKAQGTEVVTRGQDRYLGQSPILALKDSTGADVYYYELVKYDDEIFAKALSAMDSAISLHPERLDYRFLKANAYMSYERESPDMALSNILGLVHDYMTSGKEWTYQDAVGQEPYAVDKEMFADLMQEYCFAFYSLGTPSAYAAFLKLSQRLNEYFPKNPDFLGNIGSYHMVAAKDFKTALKFYDKALKLEPDNVSTINNALLAARRMNNIKLEKKYLKMLLQHADSEQTRLQAQGRLDALNAR